MPQYPAADPTFTTKQDGIDYPQAAHINDLQNEVSAIGTALRGTLAHGVTATGNISATGALSIGGGSTLTTVQAGASTVATLQVTGTSTFTGVVTFSAGISVATFADPVAFSSGLSISTGIIRQNSLPAWDVFHSTHVAQGSNSTNGASFDSQDYVRGNIEHSTASNSSRVTLNSTGLYYVRAATFIHGGVNPNCRGRVLLNDTTPLLEGHLQQLINGSSEGTLVVSGQVLMTSSGYLTFQVMSENSAASTRGSSSAIRATRFQGHFIG